MNVCDFGRFGHTLRYGVIFSVNELTISINQQKQERDLLLLLLALSSSLYL